MALNDTFSYMIAQNSTSSSKLNLIIDDLGENSASSSNTNITTVDLGQNYSLKLAIDVYYFICDNLSNQNCNFYTGLRMDGNRKP